MDQGTQEMTHRRAVRSQRPPAPCAALAAEPAVAWPFSLPHTRTADALPSTATSRRDLERENAMLRQALQRLEDRMELRFSALEKRVETAVSGAHEVDERARAAERGALGALESFSQRLGRVEGSTSQAQNQLQGVEGRVDTLAATVDVAGYRRQGQGGGKAGSGGQGGGDSGALAAEVARLRTVIAEKDAADQAALDNEKKKAAILFAEVSRLGKMVEGAVSRVDATERDSRARAERAEAAAEAAQQEASLAQEASSRAGSEAAAQANQAVQGAKDAAAAESRRAEAALEREAAARQQLEERHAAFLREVREGLARVDEESANRVAAALAEMTTRGNGWDPDAAARAEARAVEAATATARAVEAQFARSRDALAARIADAEASLLKETERREGEIRTLREEASARWQQLSAETLAESAARAEGERALGDAVKHSLKDREADLQELRQHQERSSEALEEVLRAEVRARVSAERRLQQRVEALAQSVGRAVETVRDDASQRIRDAVAMMRKAEGEMRERVEEASSDARKEARGATRAMEAAHTDLQNSLDALELALSANKEEQQQLVAPLRAEIERVHAVATDATSALSSALQEARREAKEAAETATATAQQEVDSAGRALTTRLAQVQEDTRRDLQDLNELLTSELQEVRASLTAGREADREQRDAFHAETLRREEEAEVARVLSGLVTAVSTGAAAEGTAQQALGKANSAAAEARTAQEAASRVEEEAYRELGTLRGNAGVLEDRVSAAEEAVASVAEACDQEANARAEGEMAAAEALREAISSAMTHTRTLVGRAAEARANDTVSAVIGSLVDRVAVDAAASKGASVEASAARYAEHVVQLERRTDEDAAALHKRLDGLHEHVETRFGALSDMRGEQERQWQAALETAQAFADAPDQESDSGTGGADAKAEGGDEERQATDAADAALDAALREE